MAEFLPEYLGNLRELLNSDLKRWRMIVERQVLTQVLPKLKGSRTSLEPGLWELLILCLDGVEANAPELDDEHWEAARQAAADGQATANWIERQPWFDGRLAAWGPSYLGYSLWAMATAKATAAPSRCLAERSRFSRIPAKGRERWVPAGVRWVSHFSNSRVGIEAVR